jgi:DNA processing protein
VTLEDEEYPQLLKEIKNPPFVLYGRGSLEILTGFARQPGVLSGLLCSTIAVVGTRKTTEYGREVTKLLTTELVLNGFTIVSGLALGVDAISHVTALENNGKTIAVLGCGVDCCSPGENQSIYNSILESENCIISEFPLGMKPAKWTFPARNRIIAGLSQAVLVTEGAEDSGSLITANFALKFNRKVFAVPGPITSSMSKGPYKLIQKGATLVTSGEDILEELKVQSVKLKVAVQSLKFNNATEEELKILKLLENENLHFDEILRKTKFTSSKLGVILSLMEIKGMIKSLDGGMFGL